MNNVIIIHTNESLTSEMQPDHIATYNDVSEELKLLSNGVSCEQGEQHSTSTQPSGITISPSRDWHSCVLCTSSYVLVIKTNLAATILGLT